MIEILTDQIIVVVALLFVVPGFLLVGHVFWILLHALDRSCPCGKRWRWRP